MTLFFNDNEIQIYRFRRVGSTNKLTFSATFTTYEADIQPASPERTELISGQVGHVFTAFVDVTAAVQEGDQLRVVGDDKIYNVKGVNRWQGAGLLDHIELTLVSEDDNG